MAERSVYYNPLLTISFELSPNKADNSNKLKKSKKLNSKQVFKGSEFNSLFCDLTTPSLFFDLIFVRGKLKSANSSWLNFRKYTPLLVALTKYLMQLTALNLRTYFVLCLKSEIFMGAGIFLKVSENMNLFVLNFLN